MNRMISGKNIEPALREKHGLPAEWRWVKLDCHEQPEDFIRVEGGIYPTVYKSGPRKGKTNFSKPKPGSYAVLFIRSSEVREWEERQERETGQCMRCDGSGQEMWGWSATEGNRTRDCARCGATGKAPVEAKA